jgi:hypothetical protein
VPLSFVIFLGLDTLSGGALTMPRALATALANASFSQTALAALLVTAAGVPLGYLIYQVYFYIRWNSPIACQGFLPPLVVGRKKDLLDTVKDITPQELALSDEWRKNLLPDFEDHRAAWHYLARIVMDSLLAPGVPASVYPRHEYLMAMMHSLGASFLGLCLGFAAYVVFKWREHEIPFASMVFPALLTFLVIVFLHFEDTRSSRGGIVLGPVHVHDAGELFLASLLFLFISINPVVATLLPFPWPLLIAVICGLLWVNFARGSKRALGALLAILTFASLLVKWLVPANLLGLLSWQLIFTTISFLALVVAFVENRQNVRDQIVTMEYYYLRQYLEARRKAAA